MRRAIGGAATTSTPRDDHLMCVASQCQIQCQIRGFWGTRGDRRPNAFSKLLTRLTLPASSSPSHPSATRSIAVATPGSRVQGSRCSNMLSAQVCWTRSWDFLMPGHGISSDRICENQGSIWAEVDEIFHVARSKMFTRTCT
jgi:hypothetical protein